MSLIDRPIILLICQNRNDPAQANIEISKQHPQIKHPPHRIFPRSHTAHLPAISPSAPSSRRIT